jgi:CheY-like chemotaxis protein
MASAETFLQSAGMKDTWCLITDVRLPEMSGLQLQGRMLDAGIKVPIIFIMAYPDEMIRSRDGGRGSVLPPQACYRRRSAVNSSTNVLAEPARAVTPTGISLSLGSASPELLAE